ncbi:phospholipase A2 group IID [Phyllostomus discolor]|uniref:Phospholipase A2 n=1 Tax=Phyllostomus discolor TaxID=89673 RepID=A0A6J2LS12_9CHIR|nr:group IID secretory phospholipase A2 [Phyllostomus discolor]KAF6110731.1 phospholipase A2 group IID [Phyllostomus discolor]
MELPLLCALLVLTCGTPAQGGMWNLNKMITQVTGKRAITSYWPYGCHCGPGGKGTPVDATDRCCHTHDCCYIHLKLHNCRFIGDHYKYNFSQEDVQCYDKGSWCEQQLCDCDKEVAFCLKRNLGTYNKKLRFARFSKSRCKDQSPMC